MEEKEEITQSLQPEESIEEKLDERNKEDKDIHMLEATQIQEDLAAEKHQNEKEVQVDNKGSVEEEKLMRKSQTDSSKKSKQCSKENPRTKVTVPRPFCLATEKRMSRERRGSMDFNECPKPTLTKSASLNYKNVARPLVGAERTSELRRVSSTRTATKTSLKPKLTTGEQIEKIIENGSTTKDKIQVKEVEKKKLQVIAKEGDELESKKLRKSFSFKALPLPSFYKQKDPLPKPETKKIPVTHSKPPLIGQQSKIVSKSDTKKTEEKGKKQSRTISSSAKEAISKILRTTRSSLSTPKDMVKEVVSTA